MRLCTCVCILHQHPQCIRVNSFHLDLVLLCLSNVTGEHGRKVVRHGREDQSVWTKRVSDIVHREWTAAEEGLRTLTLQPGCGLTDGEKMQPGNDDKTLPSFKYITHLHTSVSTKWSACLLTELCVRERCLKFTLTLSGLGPLVKKHFTSFQCERRPWCLPYFSVTAGFSTCLWAFLFCLFALWHCRTICHCQERCRLKVVCK